MCGSWCVQVLKAPVPQIGTLQDLRCITASGVTRGSAWRVPELTGTHYRFGSGAGASSAGAAAEAAEQEAAMEALAEALKAQEDAEQRQAAAQQVCALTQAHLQLHASCPGLTKLCRHHASTAQQTKRTMLILMQLHI